MRCGNVQMASLFKRPLILWLRTSKCPWVLTWNSTVYYYFAWVNLGTRPGITYTATATRSTDLLVYIQPLSSLFIPPPFLPLPLLSLSLRSFAPSLFLSLPAPRFATLPPIASLYGCRLCFSAVQRRSLGSPACEVLPD